MTLVNSANALPRIEGDRIVMQARVRSRDGEQYDATVEWGNDLRLLTITVLRDGAKTPLIKRQAPLPSGTLYQTINPKNTPLRIEFDRTGRGLEKLTAPDPRIVSPSMLRSPEERAFSRRPGDAPSALSIDTTLRLPDRLFADTPLGRAAREYAHARWELLHSTEADLKSTRWATVKFNAIVKLAELVSEGVKSYATTSPQQQAETERALRTLFALIPKLPDRNHTPDRSAQLFKLADRIADLSVHLSISENSPLSPALGEIALAAARAAGNLDRTTPLPRAIDSRTLLVNSSAVIGALSASYSKSDGEFSRASHPTLTTRQFGDPDTDSILVYTYPHGVTYPTAGLAKWANGLGDRERAAFRGLLTAFLQHGVLTLELGTYHAGREAQITLHNPTGESESGASMNRINRAAYDVDRRPGDNVILHRALHRFVRNAVDADPSLLNRIQKVIDSLHPKAKEVLEREMKEVFRHPESRLRQQPPDTHKLIEQAVRIMEEYGPQKIFSALPAPISQLPENAARVTPSAPSVGNHLTLNNVPSLGVEKLLADTDEFYESMTRRNLLRAEDAPATSAKPRLPDTLHQALMKVEHSADLGRDVKVPSTDTLVTDSRSARASVSAFALNASTDARAEAAQRAWRNAIALGMSGIGREHSGLEERGTSPLRAEMKDWMKMALSLTPNGLLSDGNGFILGNGGEPYSSLLGVVRKAMARGNLGPGYDKIFGQVIHKISPATKPEDIQAGVVDGVSLASFATDLRAAQRDLNSREFQPIRMLETLGVLQWNSERKLYLPRVPLVLLTTPTLAPHELAHIVFTQGFDQNRLWAVPSYKAGDDAISPDQYGKLSEEFALRYQ